jgi:hypothetical protein
VNGWTGGVAGYDDMHPTMVMYARAAEAIVDKIVDPSGPEKHAPNPASPPVAAFPANHLPQCVADALTNGSARSAACPQPAGLQPLHTALDMSVGADLTIALGHEYLGLLGTKAASTSQLPSARERNAVGCVLANSLMAVGHRPNPNNNASAGCTAVEQIIFITDANQTLVAVRYSLADARPVSQRGAIAHGAWLA